MTILLPFFLQTFDTKWFAGIVEFVDICHFNNMNKNENQINEIINSSFVEIQNYNQAKNVANELFNKLQQMYKLTEIHKPLQLCRILHTKNNDGKIPLNKLKYYYKICNVMDIQLPSQMHRCYQKNICSLCNSKINFTSNNFIKRKNL